MVFQFIFDKKDYQKYNKLVPDFCNNYLLPSIKRDLRKRINISVMNKRKKYLIESGIINWKRTPRDLNMYALCNFIIDSFVCERLKNNIYCIKINRRRIIPNSYTRVDKVARFIDKGNEKVHATGFISIVLNKYHKRINKYWSAYLAESIGVIELKECIKIM